jgi:hypothetical protein
MRGLRLENAGQVLADEELDNGRFIIVAMYYSGYATMTCSKDGQNIRDLVKHPKLEDALEDMEVRVREDKVKKIRMLHCDCCDKDYGDYYCRGKCGQWVERSILERNPHV